MMNNNVSDEQLHRIGDAIFSPHLTEKTRLLYYNIAAVVIDHTVSPASTPNKLLYGPSYSDAAFGPEIHQAFYPGSLFPESEARRLVSRLEKDETEQHYHQVRYKHGPITLWNTFLYHPSDPEFCQTEFNAHGLVNATPEELETALADHIDILYGRLDDPEALASCFLSYLYLQFGGYKEPKNATAEFKRMVGGLLETSYIELFNVYKMQKASTTVVYPVPNDTERFSETPFSNPYVTLVLDYAYKGFATTDASFLTYHPAVYRAFLKMMVDNTAYFEHFVRLECIEREPYAQTHPDFLEAIDHFVHLPRPDDSTDDETVYKTLAQYMATYEHQLGVSQYMQHALVYRTTYNGRYAAELSQLRQVGAFAGLQTDVVLDIGSSYAGFSGIDLSKCLKDSGAVSENGVQLVCVDASCIPAPGGYIDETQDYIREALGIQCLLEPNYGLHSLSRAGSFDPFSQGPKGVAVGMFNSLIPHTMDRGVNVLKHCFQVGADPIILTGGFYDMTCTENIGYMPYHVFRRTREGPADMGYTMRTYWVTPDRAEVMWK